MRGACFPQMEIRQGPEGAHRVVERLGRTDMAPAAPRRGLPRPVDRLLAGSRLLLLCLAVALAACRPAAAPTPSLTTFTPASVPGPTLTAGSAPEAIAADPGTPAARPSGSPAAGSPVAAPISGLSPATTVAPTPPALAVLAPSPSAAAPPAAGQSGPAAAGTVVAAIRVATASVASYGNPPALAFGNGAIWAARAVWKEGGRVAGEVVRIDPATNQVFDAAAGFDAEPYALAFGDGALWVGSLAKDQVFRIDPRSGRVVATIPLRKPTSVVWDGSVLWVVAHRDQEVARIDPRTNAVVGRAAVKEGGSHPACGVCLEVLAVGQGGAWVTGAASGQVYRFDQRTGDLVAAVPVEASPRRIALIDPRTNRVARVIPVPSPPYGVVVGDGVVWAISRTDSVVVRVDPTE
jgi:hypothetical protein